MSKLKKNKSAKAETEETECALIIKADIEILSLYGKNGDKIPNDKWNHGDFVCDKNLLSKHSMISSLDMDMSTTKSAFSETKSDYKAATEMKQNEISENVAIYQLIEYGNKQPLLRQNSSSILIRQATQDGNEDMYEPPPNADVQDMIISNPCTPSGPPLNIQFPDPGATMDPLVLTPGSTVFEQEEFNDLPEEEDEGNDDDEKGDELEQAVNTKDVPEKDLVANWLKNDVKLPQYLELFIENGLDDMEVILTLNEKDLLDAGIKKIGHRKKIMMKIANELEKMRLNESTPMTMGYNNSAEGANVITQK